MDDGADFAMDSDNVISNEAISSAAASSLTLKKDDDAMKPDFSQLSALQMNSGKFESRKVPVPPHRLSPLKNQWMDIYKPIVEHMKLQIRMNQKTRTVQLRTSRFTTDSGALQKAEDFLKAFMLGFAIEDAIALLRIDDLYVDTFDVTDVKRLSGANLGRAIGRISGKDGKTKFAIENSTRTRIVVADSKIHLLGSFTNIKIARDAICDLILGSPASKVYNRLRQTSSRSVERF
mmetsp:Transcript_23347/g.31888  ORF Transcript_23347/g.31888 Transcript_23347/m.31888 type:complete len:234 (+) Transcript_23347:84-785(+)|eukprot:CAMPEP_0201475008 /NCGR_PEP_ID=MMETSP0151_2-20130828/501_1 /ASSEMBLY_ACC=CAM_ASM_000257 /TAXON_ID=200890 /ORGANISM="Paramoeba atlantica, Strain 621/1 / CCAP 1560/9" /LENGTH=233 /DNA_ID=CAMNT_0047854993 /DNA_START=78 /DNA_END=779 /DNA_ORIENTATION=-